ncbi:SBBP repeat-containing protein [bacterium]|nr:SBBP repeat-containing protein [bacterium]
MKKSLILLLACLFAGSLQAAATLNSSTFLGGSFDDFGYAIAIDGSGFTYLTGKTSSWDLPTTAGAYSVTNNAGDVFVTKLDQTGSALIYSTFLGGGSYEQGNAIGVDLSGNAYVSGKTVSNNFPAISGNFDNSYNGNGDAFLTKLNVNGTALVYSTYIGGSQEDFVSGIFVTPSGLTYLTGATNSNDFPSTPSYDSSFNGNGDAFIVKFNSAGDALDFATFLGSTNYEAASIVTVDGSGNVYVGGHTFSSDFPTTFGAYDTSWNYGNTDAFITKFNSTASSLIFSTLLGGGNTDYITGLAIDPTGNLFFAGHTFSNNFPTTSLAYDTSFNGGNDVFVGKLNSTGSAITFSTLLGGTSYDYCTGLAIDPTGTTYLTGYTSSNNFPTSLNAYDNTFNGENDVFISKVSSTGTNLLYSTFLGGSQHDEANGLVLNNSFYAFIGGYTSSVDFPTVLGAFDPSFNGNKEVFTSSINFGGTGDLAITNFTVSPNYVCVGNPISFDVTVSNLGANSSDGTVVLDFDGDGDFDFSQNFSGLAAASSTVLTFNTTSTTGVSFTPLVIATLDNAVDTNFANNSATSSYANSTENYDVQFLTASFVTTPKVGFSTILNVTLKNNGCNSASGTVTVDWFNNGTSVSTLAFGPIPFNGTQVISFTSPIFPANGNQTLAVSSNLTSGTDEVPANNNGTVNYTVDSAPANDYSTYLGHKFDDFLWALDVRNGFAYVGGSTKSSDFPLVAGAFDTVNNAGDCFVTKLNQAGTALVYSTYLGGSAAIEEINKITVDGNGNAFATGTTTSTDFPTTVGAYDETFNGGNDIFITKLNTTGSGLEFSTYLGTNVNELSNGTSVDASGSFYITGYASSNDFPTTAGTLDQTWSGNVDVFLTKLNSTGNALNYSTFVGDTNYDYGYAVFVDAATNVYLGGHTFSIGFPTTSGTYDTSWNGAADAFLLKLDPTASSLIYSTLIGMDFNDYIWGLEVDSSGNAYVCGQTQQATLGTFPTTPAAHDRTFNGGAFDCFVAKFNPTATTLLYSTLLGGNGDDYANSLSLDQNNFAYVTGYTFSSNFSVTPGAFDDLFNGERDAFVARINTTASTLTYSTFLGGTLLDEAYGIYFDKVNPAFYVAGTTRSNNYPTLTGSYDITFNRNRDGFITKFGASYLADIAVTNVTAVPNSVCAGTSMTFQVTVTNLGLVTVDGVVDVDVNNDGVSDVLAPFNGLIAGTSQIISISATAPTTGISPFTAVANATIIDENDYNLANNLGSANYSWDSLSDDVAFVSAVFTTSPFVNSSSNLQVTLQNNGCNAASGNLTVDWFNDTSNLTTLPYGPIPSHGTQIINFTSPLFPTVGNLTLGVSATLTGDLVPANNNGTLNYDVEAFFTPSFSTFFGHKFDDYCYAIAVANDEPFIAGSTKSSDFPITSGVFDTVNNGGDCFVTKFNSAGNALIFSTYFGGTASEEQANAIAVDTDGNVFLTGETNSTNFATTAGSAMPSFNGGTRDAFLTKFNSGGTALVYSTYLGGSSVDKGFAVSVISGTSPGEAIVTGWTSSVTYPVTGASFDNSHSGNTDAFVTRLNGTGSAIDYSTFLGESNYDYGHAIKISGTSVYVSGHTFSNNFPTTAGTYDETFNINADAFATNFNTTLNSLTYSTYLGGELNDYVWGITTDYSNSLFLAGHTGSTNFPVSGTAYQKVFGGGNFDALAAKLNSTGNKLLYATYLGGTSDEYANAVSVVGSTQLNSVCVAGYTFSSDYPTTFGAFDNTYNGDRDGFLSRLNGTGSVLTSSSFLGGTALDEVTSMDAASSNSVFLTGNTHSNNFPATIGSYDFTYNKNKDIFVSKFSFTDVGNIALTSLSVDKTVSCPNEALVFSATVQNNGIHPANGIVDLDVDGNGTYDFSQTFTGLAPGSSVVVTINALSPAPYIFGAFGSSAYVSLSGTGDTSAGNDFQTIGISHNSAPDLTINSASFAASPQVGNTTALNVVVKNILCLPTPVGGTVTVDWFNDASNTQTLPFTAIAGGDSTIVSFTSPSFVNPGNFTMNISQSLSDANNANNSINVNYTVGFSPLNSLFTDKFENNSGNWEFLNSDVSVGWKIDQTPVSVLGANTPFSGNACLKYRNVNNYETANSESNKGSATSNFEVNLTNLVNPWVSFATLYETETSGTDYDQRWLEISNDNFSTVLAQVQLQNDVMGMWSYKQIPLDPTWGTVKFRFSFDTVDELANNFSGWFVDDFEVFATPNCLPTQEIVTATITKDNNDVVINWTVSQGATNYRVHFGTNANDLENKIDVGNNLTWRHVDALNSGETYFYAVTAMCGISTNVVSSANKNSAIISATNVKQNAPLTIFNSNLQKVTESRKAQGRRTVQAKKTVETLKNK